MYERGIGNFQIRNMNVILRINEYRQFPAKFINNSGIKAIHAWTEKLKDNQPKVELRLSRTLGTPILKFQILIKLFRKLIWTIFPSKMLFFLKRSGPFSFFI